MSYRTKTLASRHVAKKVAVAMSTTALVAPTVLAAVPQVALAEATINGTISKSDLTPNTDNDLKVGYDVAYVASVAVGSGGEAGKIVITPKTGFTAAGVQGVSTPLQSTSPASDWSTTGEMVFNGGFAAGETGFAVESRAALTDTTSAKLTFDTDPTDSADGVINGGATAVERQFGAYTITIKGAGITATVHPVAAGIYSQGTTLTFSGSSMGYLVNGAYAKDLTLTLTNSMGDTVIEAAAAVVTDGLYDTTFTGTVTGSPIDATDSLVKNLSDGTKDMTFTWVKGGEFSTVTVKKGAKATYDGNAITVTLVNASDKLYKYGVIGGAAETVKGTTTLDADGVDKLTLSGLKANDKVVYEAEGTGTTLFTQYNVNYHTEGGRIFVENQNVQGTDYVTSREPGIAGKTFLGWATTASGLDAYGEALPLYKSTAQYAAIFGAAVSSKEQHLYAQYGTNYQLAFDGDGGNVTTAVDAKNKKGVNYRDYGNEGTDDTLYVGLKASTNADKMLGTTDTLSVANKYQASDAEGNELYFAGWKVGDTFVSSVKDITEDMVSGGKVTLVAQWSPVKLENIKVTWLVSTGVEGYVDDAKDTNSGNSSTAANADAATGNATHANLKTAKTAFTATAVTDVNQDGYAFWGWNTKADGTGYGFKAGKALSADDALALAKIGQSVVLYAQWKPAYRVVLDSNVEDGGNTAANGTTSVVAGESGIDKDKANVIAFVGEAAKLPTWYAGRGLDGSYEFAESVFGSRFYYLGRSEATAKSKKLSGWATTAKGDVAVADGGYTNASVDALRDAKKHYEVTLFARWDDKVNYTVTFYPNFATADDVVSSNLTVGNSVKNLDGGATYKRSGWKLVKWTTGRDGSGDSFAPGFDQTAALDALGANAVSNNVQLFAQWAEATTVTFKANGGYGADATQILTTSESLPATPMFTNGTKVFTGWALDEAGTKKVSTLAEAAAAAEDGAVTLYATWADATPEPVVKAGWYKDSDGDYHYATAVVDGKRVDAKGWSRGGTTKYYYYFDKTTGKMKKNAWVKDGAYWYHFGARGAMEHDKPIAYKGVNYWLNSRGAAIKA